MARKQRLRKGRLYAGRAFKGRLLGAEQGAEPLPDLAAAPVGGIPMPVRRRGVPMRHDLRYPLLPELAQPAPALLVPARTRRQRQARQLAMLHH